MTQPVIVFCRNFSKTKINHKINKYLFRSCHCRPASGISLHIFSYYCLEIFFYFIQKYIANNEINFNIIDVNPNNDGKTYPGLYQLWVCNESAWISSERRLDPIISLSNSNVFEASFIPINDRLSSSTNMILTVYQIEI